MSISLSLLFKIPKTDFRFGISGKFYIRKCYQIRFIITLILDHFSEGVNKHNPLTSRGTTFFLNCKIVPTLDVNISPII